MFYERNISVEITDINYNVNPDSSELFCVTEAAKVLMIVYNTPCICVYVLTIRSFLQVMP